MADNPGNLGEGLVIADLVVRYLADINDIKSKLKDLDASNKAVQESAKRAANDIKGFADTVQNSANILSSSLQLIASVGLLRVANDMAVTSGRGDELQKVMYIMGKNAGYTKTQLDGIEGSMRKYGISINEARQSIVNMIQAGLDLNKSLQLARTAQDLAVISQSNSSETMQRLTTAIQERSTMMLRYMGIIVDQPAAEAEYARSLGKTASELSKGQQQQALMNAVLKEGAKMTGAYEEAMNSWTKTQRSTQRYLDEMKVTLGEGLQKPLLYLERSLQQSTVVLSGLSSETKSSVGHLLLFGSVALTAVTGLRTLLFMMEQGTKTAEGFGLATKNAQLALKGLAVAGVLLATTEGGKALVESSVSSVQDLTRSIAGLFHDIDISDSNTGEHVKATWDGVQSFVGAKIMGIGNAWSAVIALIMAGLSEISQEEAKLKPRLEAELKLDYLKPKSLEEAKKQLNDINSEIKKATIALIGTSKLNDVLFNIPGMSNLGKMGGYDVEENERNRVKLKILKDLRSADADYTKTETERLRVEENLRQHTKELDQYGFTTKYEAATQKLTPQEQRKALQDIQDEWKKVQLNAQRVHDKTLEAISGDVVKKTQDQLNQIPSIYEEAVKKLEELKKKGPDKQLLMIAKEIAILNEEDMVKNYPIVNKLLEERQKIYEQMIADDLELTEQQQKEYDRTRVILTTHKLRAELSKDYYSKLDEIQLKLNILNTKESLSSHELEKQNELRKESLGLVKKLYEHNEELIKQLTELSGKDIAREYAQKINDVKNLMALGRITPEGGEDQIKQLEQNKIQAMNDRANLANQFYDQIKEAADKVFERNEISENEHAAKLENIEKMKGEYKISIYQETQKTIEQLLQAEQDKVVSIQDKIAGIYRKGREDGAKAKQEMEALMGLNKPLTGAPGNAPSMGELRNKIIVNPTTEGLNQWKEAYGKLSDKDKQSTSFMYGSEIALAAQRAKSNEAASEARPLELSLEKASTQYDSLMSQAQNFRAVIADTKYNLEIDKAGAGIKTLYEMLRSGNLSGVTPRVPAMVSSSTSVSKEYNDNKKVDQSNTTIYQITVDGKTYASTDWDSVKAMAEREKLRHGE